MTLRGVILASYAGCVVVGVGALSFNADAQEVRQSLHNIPWYVAHPAVREATLKFCRSDHEFSHSVDCLNAETAATKAWGRRAAGELPGGRRSNALFPELTDPQYWAANRLNRRGVMAACRGRSIYTPDVCAAARKGDALDPRSQT